MSARKKTTIVWILLIIAMLPTAVIFATPTPAQETIATQLGWIPSKDNNCGGYYIDHPFTVADEGKGEIQIAGDFGLYALHGTSSLDGATFSRSGQQITANKAFLYRDPQTFKLTSAEMLGDVHLREPNTLIIGKRGRYDFVTETKSLLDILYRTTLAGHQVIGPAAVSKQDMAKERRVLGLTAWGHAAELSQTQPQIYDMKQASFTTCPPIHPTWQVKGSHIEINKNTGRGYATNARLLLHGIPVLYMPYFNFTIDHKRKTGFLWPTVAFNSSSWGPSVLLPFYWNIAPNYDMTITTGILSKRGVQLSDRFRYLLPNSKGSFFASALPSDRYFMELQRDYKNTYSSSTDPTIQAELTRLLNSATTRKSMYWRNETRFNQHWSSHINYNYAGDDYYLQDFGSNLSEITQNQLLQVGDVTYQGPNWNFIGRLQAYQTLHPIIVGQAAVQNQYRRFPQLVLNGNYPNQLLGLEYFIENEVTHFDIRNTPGTPANLPIGNRMHMQPGISLPLYWPYFYVNPRLQVALSDYQLYQITPTATPGSIHRGVPIFDIASGVSFINDTHFFHHFYQQTLEPQVYYTYIPYRNQSSIPIFDTTVNTLTYDQLFNYNRFSGIDRIGDANQIGIGFTTRLIEGDTGLEKARLGVGELVYFADRQVTQCNSPSVCSDNPTNPDLHRQLSPLSGVLNYAVSPLWNLNATSIWNPITKQLDNSTIGIHFQPDPDRLINLGYNYARSGDILSGIQTTSPQNNLKVTDFSFAWPLIRDINVVGKWSQNWNHRHLQNLLYGVQYDTCCWAVRLAGGRAFTQYQNQTPQYNSEYYIQFALKGLGNIGSGNPTNMLSSINGYNTHFGQDI